MLKRIWNKLGIYKTYPYSLNDRTFKIPVHKGLGMSNFSDPESWMSEILKKIGSEKLVLIDIGVNVGQTLLKWKSLFPNAGYVGCEPNEACISYVEKLIKENNFTNCKLIDAGISEKSGDGVLYMLGNDRGDSSASIIKDFRANETRKGMEVRLTTFAELKLAACDILKIDVEGAELGVVQSLFHTKLRPVIVIEILPVYSDQNIGRMKRQMSLEKLMHENEYKIFRIVKGEAVKLESLSEIGIHDRMDWCDYVMVPQEKVQLISALIRA